MVDRKFFPEAYKTGRVLFFGREFCVSSDTLIPRPETEQIIDAVLSLFGKTALPGVKPKEARIFIEDFKKRGEKVRILDVGTGTGCIGITLKKEIPEAEVVLTDVSEEALEVARNNARKLSASVEIVQSDLLTEISHDFQVIVANLPYVDRNWEWLENDESQGIKFEPEVALFAEDGGLELIFKLFIQAKERTKYLVLEADPCQHERIIRFAKKNGWKFEERRGFSLLFVFV